MSPGVAIHHRQCGTDFYQQEEQTSEATMASLTEFETKYLSSDPEVFVDFLSIKSLKKRYLGSSNSDNGVFYQWNHNVDDDFETFVQEFPIDDNISECFASSSDDTVKDLEGVMSEDNLKAAKRLKQKNEKETSNKVSEAVNDIEKKLLENRRLKGGTNLFRRKGKQNVLSKKSFSFDDLRTTGTCLDSASQAKAKIPIRRCRVLQESGDNQRIDSLTHCRSNAASDSILLEKKNPGVSNLWAKENSAHVEPPRDALKSCLRNGDSNENHIDLRLIKARTLAPDKGPIGNLKLQRTGLSGVVGHRVLRKALRDSAMGRKTTATTENRLSTVCMACRDLKLTETGSTTAHSAAYMGHLQCLQALVESAADITAVNHEGMKPSQVALSTGHFDCWNYLTVTELSHVLLRELCNYGSLIERITTQLEFVRSEMVKVKQCLEKKSQDLNRQVRSLLDLTTAINRNLVAYPSSKQKCLGHPGSIYQDVQDSLTLLECMDRKLHDLCNVDCTIAGSDSFRSLEMAVHKTEDLLIDDLHMNDIRQLENVQKRNRVIRNFLIEDEHRQNSRLRGPYAESVSSESVVSRGSRIRQLQTRAIVDPVVPSVVPTSSSHFNNQDRRKKPGKKKHHHDPRHRHKQDLDLTKLPPPSALHPAAVHSHYRQRHRSRSASSSLSPRRSETHGEDSRFNTSTSSSTGSSASSSCSDSEAASSDWETTSQGSIGTLNVNSDISEEPEQARVLEASHSVDRGPISCDWSFLRSAVQDDNYKTKNKDTLSQSSLEVCIGYADRASSAGSLRRYRLANHFHHIDKDAKQKSGLMERVIKGDADRYESASGSASVVSKRSSQDQEKRTSICNSLTGVISDSNVGCSARDIKTVDAPFSSASSSSPSSSRRTVIRSVALDEAKTTRQKPAAPLNFCNTNALREELIGRCRQVPMDIHNPSRTAETLEESFQEKPWYDVSDDETSVCTWTNEMLGYESESSYYQ